MALKNFDVEIIECENGYIILAGNSLADNTPYHMNRKKWVARDVPELQEVVGTLALEVIKARSPKNET